jgi:hypothetical protein
MKNNRTMPIRQFVFLSVPIWFLSQYVLVFALILGLLITGCCSSAPEPPHLTGPLTVEDLIACSQAGMSDDKIIASLHGERASLTQQQRTFLSKHGVSERVIDVIDSPPPFIRGQQH